MIATRAVASFTLQLPVSEWPAWIRRDCMLSAEQSQRFGVVMTGNAAVGPVPAVGCLILWLRGRGNQQAKANEACEAANCLPIRVHVVP